MALNLRHALHQRQPGQVQTRLRPTEQAAMPESALVFLSAQMPFSLSSEKQFLSWDDTMLHGGRHLGARQASQQRTKYAQSRQRKRRKINEMGQILDVCVRAYVCVCVFLYSSGRIMKAESGLNCLVMHLEGMNSLHSLPDACGPSTYIPPT